MPNTPEPSARSADPRLQRRRAADEELEKMTTAEAMANLADDADAMWDQDSGLPGLTAAEGDDGER